MHIQNIYTRMLLKCTIDLWGSIKNILRPNYFFSHYCLVMWNNHSYQSLIEIVDCNLLRSSFFKRPDIQNKAYDLTRNHAQAKLPLIISKNGGTVRIKIARTENISRIMFRLAFLFRKQKARDQAPGLSRMWHCSQLQRAES